MKTLIFKKIISKIKNIFLKIIFPEKSQKIIFKKQGGPRARLAGPPLRNYLKCPFLAP